MFKDKSRYYTDTPIPKGYIFDSINGYFVEKYKPTNNNTSSGGGSKSTKKNADPVADPDVADPDVADPDVADPDGADPDSPATGLYARSVKAIRTLSEENAKLKDEIDRLKEEFGGNISELTRENKRLRIENDSHYKIVLDTMNVYRDHVSKTRQSRGGGN